MAEKEEKNAKKFFFPTKQFCSFKNILFPSPIDSRVPLLQQPML
jgi:hypothetical protein